MIGMTETAGEIAADEMAAIVAMVVTVTIDLTAISPVVVERLLPNKNFSPVAKMWIERCWCVRVVIGPRLQF
jgi:chorismate mutase